MTAEEIAGEIAQSLKYMRGAAKRIRRAAAEHETLGYSTAARHLRQLAADVERRMESLKAEAVEAGRLPL
jgi:hypothetical protein